MKIAYISANLMSRRVLEGLIKYGFKIEFVISPKNISKKTKSDADNLEFFEHDIPRYQFNSVNSPETLEILKKNKIDLLICLGISEIIKANLLKIPRIGTIGGHISLLPMNRGCSPIIWAIANGLDQSGLSMFWMNDKIDDGKIIYQKKFEINDNENATDIYKKVTKHYIEGLAKKILPTLLDDKKIKALDNKHKNYWRRRKFTDGVIDWRMSNYRIRNLTRALAPPYPGATAVVNNDNVVVNDCSLVTADENRIPGEIIAKTNDNIIVKCGHGAISIKPIPVGFKSLKVGDYI